MTMAWIISWIIIGLVVAWVSAMSDINLTTRQLAGFILLWPIVVAVFLVVSLINTLRWSARKIWEALL
jgi:fucose 4-O-acetylase-like acetyltransferase